MEVEKRSSRGGFLQLFDWNVKSRKKLFSNKSEISENSKQGRENFNDSAISRLEKVYENGCRPSTRGINDLSYTSLVNGDEGYGTKAPGVVARLMGLDSLPTSNGSEPFYTPVFDSQSFRDSHYSRGFSNVRSEEHIVIYDGMRNKLDGFTKNPVEMMLQKVQSRPVERFQTEVLPPKSAKPISITHHKLLSPIKSPGFIPTMNTAYLMEAAAKIIEQSPRSTATYRLPSLGSSSSVPLKIQDLKEKMKAAQRSARIVESSQKAKDENSSKQMKRQIRDMVAGRGESSDTFKVSDASKSSAPKNLKNKEKSVSLAVQAKANVQKKNGFTSVGNQSLVNQKEHCDTKYSSASRSQSKSQKIVERRTLMSRPSDVLRLNNQKQNCVSNDDRESLRPSFSHQKDRKSVSINEASRPIKTLNRVGVNATAMSRKTSINLVGKEQPPSVMKKSALKKQLVNGNSDRNPTMNKVERSVKCNSEMEKCNRWDASERKNGMDVVSFTFASPIKKSLSASNSPGHVGEKKRSSFVASRSGESQSSFGPNVSGGDALGMLLRQKLKELTSKFESPPQELVNSEFLSTSAASVSDSISSLNMTRTSSADHDKMSQSHTPKDSPAIQCKLGRPIDEILPEAMQMWQGVQDVEGHGSISFVEYDKELKHQTPQPLPILEAAYSEGSCNSLDSTRSNCEGEKFFSIEAYEMTQWSSSRKCQPVDDLEFSDCASSASVGSTSVTDVSSSFTSTTANEPPNWELEYISHILVNTDLMLEEFAVGHAHKIMAPNLFDQFREVKLGSNRNVEENFKLVRKLLFDYVEESLEIRCAQLCSGSWKSWAKLTNSLERKDWLSEELCREISSWTSMEDFMVDELVEKDMSSHLGKWVDFETEAFEEGVDIEKGILSYLIDELVDDFFS